MSAGSVIIDIIANDKPFRDSVDRLSSRARTVGNSLTASLTLPILGLGTAFVKLAADAEEVNSKFDTVFGAQAVDVRQWATDYAASVNRSTTETLKFLASIQDLFVPLGFSRDEAQDFSKSVVQLANDLGSFNNLRTEDVLRDIQSALVGNSETVRKYGVVINAARVEQEAYNLGLAVAGEELSAAAKAQATYSLILQGTVDAQGDAERTSDSTTNSLRGLIAQLQDASILLGNELLPTVRDVVEKLTEMVAAFNDLEPGTQKAVLGVAGFLAVLGPATRAGGVLIKAAGAIKTIATGLGAITGISAGAAASLGGIFILAAGAVKIESDIIERTREVAEQFNVAEDALWAFQEILRGVDSGSSGALDAIAVNLEAIAGEAGVSAVQLARAASASDDVADSIKTLLNLYIQENESVDEINERRLQAADIESQALELTLERQEQLKQEATNREEALNTETSGQLELLDIEDEREDLQTDTNIAMQENAIIKAQAMADEILLQEEILRNENAYFESINKRIQAEKKAADLIVGIATPAFKTFGDEIANLATTSEISWGNIGASAVEAIASIIEALGQQFIVEAAGAAVKAILGNPKQLAAVAGYTAASIAAFSAAGLVRAGASQLRAADGIVVNPQAGGQTVTMAEAGVPEMALPLRTDTISMFADAIAGKMSGGSETMIRIELNGRQLDAYITEQIGNRKIRVLN
jgi:hypothetical protein